MTDAKSDEEDDYMSAEILTKIPDTRPGLVKGNTARLYKSEKLHHMKNLQNRTKSRTVLESEKRDEGLKNAISPDNKGFAMLAKMGYKKGMSLGRTGSGRVEPVPVELKAGRSGLGLEAEAQRKRKAIEARHISMTKKRHKFEQDYRMQKSQEAKEKELEKDLYRSQKVCFHLDSDKGMTSPELSFFWPETPKSSKKEKEEYDDDFDDDSEFHSKVRREIDEEEEEDVTAEEEDEFITWTAGEKLEVLTAYLRETYLYCVWCGTAYNDTEDMKRNCPGSTAADHDE